MPELLFFIKIAATAAVVVGLSLLAEYVSPKAAGILSGYPTVSAIILFFYGLEVNPEFAAKSAEYNIIGISGVLFFVYFYYRASLLFKKYNVLLSSLTAILGYFFVIWLLHFIEVNKYVAVLIPVGFSFVFIYLLKDLEDVKIKEKIKTNYKVLFLRASFAVTIILIVTSIPELVGERWAGLFSAFPSTIFPLMLIVHVTYSKEHVFTVIKNVPVGLFSVITYSLAASIAYPLYGIYWGTLLALGVATVYLLAYARLRNTTANNRDSRELKS
ncbi:MAG: hypothetical protein ABFS32_06235 [Bacteroidota bacterium]